MNYEEIIKRFEELEIVPRILVNKHNRTDEQSEFLRQFTEVYSEGGYEGEGEHAERVYRFGDSDIYICVTGFYCSNEGTEWDSDFLQVYPRRVITTVYETAADRGDKTDEA